MPDEHIRLDELGMTIRQEDMAGARHLGACIWPSGLLMAHWLKAQPWRVTNLRVLELGSGGGLVGIYASRLGASEVLSTDADLEMLRLSAENAASNDASLCTVR
jgi:predicted nicotinamide N-methyase